MYLIYRLTFFSFLWATYLFVLLLLPTYNIWLNWIVTFVNTCWGLCIDIVLNLTYLDINKFTSLRFCLEVFDFWYNLLRLFLIYIYILIDSKGGPEECQVRWLPHPRGIHYFSIFFSYSYYIYIIFPQSRLNLMTIVIDVLEEDRYKPINIY